MTKRSRHAVVRFRCYSKDVEPNNWYRAKLMLYYPWYKEDTDLLGGSQHMKSIIIMLNQQF